MSKQLPDPVNKDLSQPRVPLFLQNQSPEEFRLGIEQLAEEKAQRQVHAANLRPLAMAQATEAPQNPPSSKSFNNKTVNAQEFAAVLQDALSVVSDFGGILEEKPSPEDGFGPLQSEMRLPHSKERIMRAIFLLQAIHNSETARTMAIKALHPEEVQCFLSERYANALGSSRVWLDCYVPEGSESLHSQRQLAQDLASLMKSLGPEGWMKLNEASKEMIKAATGYSGPAKAEP